MFDLKKFLSENKLTPKSYAKGWVLTDIPLDYGIELEVWDNGDYLELGKIVIPNEERGTGVGSEVMQKVIDYADSKGQDIRLTPSKDFGATSIQRLQKFYSKFGFEKNKDQKYKDTLVRYHKALNEIGDASSERLEWNPSQIESIAKQLEKRIEKQEDGSNEYYDEQQLGTISIISPETRTRYRVTVDVSVDKPMYIQGFMRDKPVMTVRIDFTDEYGSDKSTNKGEQYKLMTTLTDIIIQLVTRLDNIDDALLSQVKFYAKDDDIFSKDAKPNSKRGKLYQAYIAKNLSKLPGGWIVDSSGKSSDAIILYKVSNKKMNESLLKKIGIYI